MSSIEFHKAARDSPRATNLRPLTKLLSIATDKDAVHVYRVEASVAIRAALIAASTAAFACGLFFQQDEPLSSAP